MATQASGTLPSILLFLHFTLLHASGSGLDDRISINCGSASASLSGREWLGDVYPKLFPSPVTLKGVSTRMVERRRKQPPNVDPVPYNTARISTSRFSYDFRLHPGQKYIRLHFNPTPYKLGSGFFKRLEDCFSVEAGEFTLLKKFSASITARVLGLNVVTKEFCVSVHKDVPLSLVFTPAVATNPSQEFYAFVNGIEIISVPSSLSYCHDEDVGVQVVGQKSVGYIDSSTALEMAFRFNVKMDYVLSRVVDDDIGMFWMGAAVEGERANKVRYKSWNVSVDVGFRYLIRLHFCRMWLKMAANGTKDFVILVDGMIVVTNSDVVEGRDGEGVLWYKNCLVMVNGNKLKGKRAILISLRTKDELVDGYGPLEGFEIFKLSNHDDSLASPNPLPPPTEESLSLTTRNLLAVLGPMNSIGAVVIMLACLVNIAVHKLQQCRKSNLPEEEIMPSTRVGGLCRCFSLVEMKTATDDFFDAFVIGKGGFGKVYMGRIDNGKQIVAIKRLKSSSKQGEREFQTEIELLSELRHANVVSLVGYSCEKQEMILVYEYVPCGSLADHLYKLARKNTAYCSLTWKQRLEICIGAGRGLDYLHTGHGIIHRDIKSSNILLDERFVPKVSDFGLAKIHTGQSQGSTNFKGTFGYFDPDYFRTHRLTMKSDTYSFGVVLLEVLCGRPAVDQLAEVEERSLTMWARDKISKGDVDQIIAPNLRDEISPASLKAFVRIVERCLHDEPKKRPTIAHVIINLEFALEQQENANSSVSNEIVGVADDLQFIDTAQPKNVNPLSEKEIEQVSRLLEVVKTESFFPKEVESGDIAINYTAMFEQEKQPALSTVGGTRQLTSSTLKNITSPLKNVVKTTMRKLSRLWPRNAFQKSGKFSKKRESIVSISAPVPHRSVNLPPAQGRTVNFASKVIHKAVNFAAAGERKSVTFAETVDSRKADLKPSDNTFSEDGKGPELLPSRPLRDFPFAELKAITRNFHFDMFLGEGGFGKVYKGFLKENGVESVVAVKKLNHESKQGFQEWQSEVKILGMLSHPNLVKLLGYCQEDKELLLIYEYVVKRSLEYHLFRRKSEPLQWDVRLKILAGAAKGLAFLHASKIQVIYRDFKVSNILLDKSYNAKLSDFGLAKLGPADPSYSHVTTGIMGTYGYAAPEYLATGHLYVKSDVYGFGVVLLEMMTGLRVIDISRPSGRQNLVDWITPQLSDWRKLKRFMDPHLEGVYPAKSAFQLAQLAQNCLNVDPKNRPSSQELVEALEKVQSTR